jgi:hypothetical protein
MWHDDPALAAGLPDPDGVEAAGFTDGNYQFDPSFALATWDEAAAALEVERDLVQAADAAAATPAQFDDFLDGDLEDWQLIALEGLEAGVAAATLALNAAGCVTTTSCRGHPGKYAAPGHDFPRVRFMADPERAAIIRTAAQDSRCAFGVEPPVVEVFARSVAEMLAFAEAILATRREFERLGNPPHRQ